MEASLVYRVSSRTAGATQRNPVSKKPNPKKEKKLTPPLLQTVFLNLALAVLELTL